MQPMYDHHAAKLLDKRIVFWVRRLSRAGNEEDARRCEAKVEALEALYREREREGILPRSPRDAVRGSRSK